MEMSDVFLLKRKYQDNLNTSSRFVFLYKETNLEQNQANMGETSYW